MRGISFWRPLRPGRSIHNLPLVLSCSLVAAVIASGCASVSARNASLSVIPASVDFRSVVVGQKNSQTVRLTNIGGQPIALQRLQLSGSGFTLSSPKTPLILAPDQSINLTILFTPSSAASDSGDLAVTSPEFASPLEIPVSGSGEKAVPSLAISPSSLGFGSHAIKSSTAQAVMLTNTGNVSVSIKSIGLTSSAFSISGLSPGDSLSPGQKLEFQVWFHPPVSGSSATALTIEPSSGAPPVTVTLTGSASGSAEAPTAAPVHSVTLDWSADSTDIKGFNIYRSEISAGPFVRINPNLVTLLTYQDTDVLAGAHYFYVVTTVSAQGQESKYSNEVSVVIP